MASLISGLVQLSLGVVVLSGVYITTVKTTNTSTWTSSEVTMWGLLTLAGIIGMVNGVLNLFGIA
jgi:hypothetical protein